MTGRAAAAARVLRLQRLLRRILLDVLSDFGFVLFGLVKVEGGGVAVQRVHWIRVGEQLGQKRLEDVHQVVHGRPCLIDHVQADSSGGFVDVRMENAIEKT